MTDLGAWLWGACGWLLVALTLAACGTVPETRYYRVQHESAGPGPATEPDAPVLWVLPFEMAPEYRFEGLAYVTQPHRIDFYRYHKWATDPAEMIRRQLTRDLEQSGLFRRVESTESPQAGDLVLRGRVVELAEVDTSPESWDAALEVECVLLRQGQRDPMLTWRYRDRRPAEQRTPRAVVAGLSQSLQAASSELVQRLRQALSEISLPSG